MRMLVKVSIRHRFQVMAKMGSKSELVFDMKSQRVFYRKRYGVNKKTK